jgi:hypothetical protein
MPNKCRYKRPATLTGFQFSISKHPGLKVPLAVVLRKEGKGKVVPVLYLTEHHAMKTYWGSGGIASRILDLGTRWR